MSGSERDMREQQVDSGHYRFDQYMTKERWISVWHQLEEVLALEPSRVLEIGPGAGLFKKVGAIYGLAIETLDIAPDLNPDHLAPVTVMPFADGAFDVVCAFQMLEHLPYDEALRAFAEMSRVAGRAIVISLPDAEFAWRFSAHIPRFGLRHWLLRKPFFRPAAHHFEGEHYWEINKQDYALDRIIADFGAIRPLLKTYRVPEFSYHRFMVFA